MKYHNQKTEHAGRLFHSKKEANFARVLDTLRKAKNIKDRVTDIEYQPKFPIVIKDKRICVYIADFRVRYADEREEIIDVKGYRTALYVLKKKLVEVLYGIEIKEV